MQLEQLSWVEWDTQPVNSLDSLEPVQLFRNVQQPLSKQ